MDLRQPNLNSWPAKLVMRAGKTFRSQKPIDEIVVKEKEKKSDQKKAVLRKKRLDKIGYVPRPGEPGHQKTNEMGEYDYGPWPITQEASFVKNKDHTDMMHRLAHNGSFDSLVDQVMDSDRLKDPYFDSTQSPRQREEFNAQAAENVRQMAALPAGLWLLIASYLELADVASLTISTSVLYHKLGPDYLHALNEPENRHQKIEFLNHLEPDMPHHLLCFPCRIYHVRSNPGKESLKIDYVANPLYRCPSVRDTVLPRMRITHGRELPYSYVQLALRSHKHSPHHGIKPEALGRRWKCKDSDWSHRTQYIVVDGHLLMRVVSQCIAPPAPAQTETSLRHMLYDREEYIPFFSVCSHWRDGDLLPMCKCALSHVPAPPRSYYQQLKEAPKLSRSAANPNFIVQGCDDCRPARRCPECPSEYLIETVMMEDTKDPIVRFKHALRVTRWSDLGDGKSPYTSPEWAAIKGLTAANSGVEAYDSFSHIGRRAVAGIFESKVCGHIPGQRMVSMNPKNEKYGEEGHGWY
ncbi:hypothetical protein BDY17DRAFT_301805 [Neohortaea acidophila]|uniref:F-box domain-containing protein n=1 Tax=Neohortaea acidophila TaxID=245834 RepID=A0A6A6PLB8_9PEZI|nr:uncharacterized protein BDY17DRAFT_301805 [Neohortaea acidophila]KAF2480454.1 hypothetical protein BDY17DRAFT_301805 [Neohortaea acidophila]